MFRRFVFAASAAAALVALSACSSPAPTPTVKSNAAACDAFSQATHTIFDKGTSDADTIALFDAAALEASGEVKARLDALVSYVSTNDHMKYFMYPEEFNTAVASVTRACSSDGFTVSPKVLPGFNGNGTN